MTKRQKYYTKLYTSTQTMTASGEFDFPLLFPGKDIPYLHVSEFHPYSQMIKKLFRLSSKNYTRLFETDVASVEALRERLNKFLS